MAFKVFIDGKDGTTGLKIYERFESRPDIEVLLIDDAKRKDTQERKKLINASDMTFLCLPDAAAVEAVSLAENDRVRFIDASTAHRTAPGWVYGFPELSAAHRKAVRETNRLANPGCHATGFISLAYPLAAHGVVAPDYPFTCHSITGYSGGGKKMIAAYESAERDTAYDSPRQYALGQKHKHQPEMQAVCGLDFPPVFNPIVADFYSGMVVTVPLLPRLMKKKMTPGQLHELLAEHYADQQFVKVMPLMGEGVLGDGMLPANTLSGTNLLEIFVLGHDDQIVLASRFDNLGKGASGAAIQCMNIMLGLDETTGLL